MTAAQKHAQANFKKAIAYRKKTGCSLKEAFAHVKSSKVTGLDKVVKKGNKTTVKYTKKAKKKAAPKKKVSQGVLFGVKKKAAKKSAVKSMHKDTKSHNVNIRVVSGINRDYIKELTQYNNELELVEKHIDSLKTFKKNDLKYFKEGHKQELLDRYLNRKKYIKNHITAIKRNIK
jgi:hypothetical protein